MGRVPRILNVAFGLFCLPLYAVFFVCISFKGKNHDEKINIVTLQGTIGASAQVGRTDGFANILAKNSNWPLLLKLF